MSIENTLQERKSSHGDFTHNARIAQQIMRVVETGPSYGELTDIMKEAIHMFAHKIARIVGGNPHVHDHWHDIAGYARLVEDRIPHAPATAVVDSFGNQYVQEEKMDPLRAAFGGVWDQLALETGFPRDEIKQAWFKWMYGARDVGSSVPFVDHVRSTISMMLENQHVSKFNVNENVGERIGQDTVEVSRIGVVKHVDSKSVTVQWETGESSVMHQDHLIHVTNTPRRISFEPWCVNTSYVDRMIARCGDTQLVKLFYRRIGITHEWVLEAHVESLNIPKELGPYYVPCGAGWLINIKKVLIGVRDNYPYLEREKNAVEYGELPEWQRTLYDHDAAANKYVLIDESWMAD